LAASFAASLNHSGLATGPPIRGRGGGEKEGEEGGGVFDVNGPVGVMLFQPWDESAERSQPRDESSPLAKELARCETLESMIEVLHMRFIGTLHSSEVGAYLGQMRVRVVSYLYVRG